MGDTLLLRVVRDGSSDAEKVVHTLSVMDVLFTALKKKILYIVIILL